MVAEWLFPSELLKAEIKKLKQKQSDEAKWHIDSQVLSKCILKISTPGLVTYLRESRRLTALPNCPGVCPGVPAYFRQPESAWLYASGYPLKCIAPLFPICTRNLHFNFAEKHVMPVMLAFSNELKQSSEVRKQKQPSFAISQNDRIFINIRQSPHWTTDAHV